MALETVGRSQDGLRLTAVVRVSPRPADGRVSYVAAAPAERRASFEGSCLPFGSERQAFDSTPTRGSAAIDEDGRFEVRMRAPNSYYTDLGTTLVPPTLYVRTRSLSGSVQVDAPVPFRTLWYPAERDGPTFYQHPSPRSQQARSQQDLLVASGYPVGGGAP